MMPSKKQFEIKFKSNNKIQPQKKQISLSKINIKNKPTTLSQTIHRNSLQQLGKLKTNPDVQQTNTPTQKIQIYRTRKVSSQPNLRLQQMGVTFGKPFLNCSQLIEIQQNPFDNKNLQSRNSEIQNFHHNQNSEVTTNITNEHIVHQSIDIPKNKHRISVCVDKLSTLCVFNNGVENIKVQFPKIHQNQSKYLPQKTQESEPYQSKPGKECSDAFKRTISANIPNGNCKKLSSLINRKAQAKIIGLIFKQKQNDM